MVSAVPVVSNRVFRRLAIESAESSVQRAESREQYHGFAMRAPAPCLLASPVEPVLRIVAWVQKAEIVSHGKNRYHKGSRQPGRQADRQTGRQADRQVGVSQVGRQAERQTGVRFNSATCSLSSRLSLWKAALWGPCTCA
jgi:hypothetical protein